MIRATFLFLVLTSPLTLQAQYAPGDSIGFTLHDFVTNGSAYRNLINLGGGSLFMARLASVDSVSLGSWFSCSSDDGFTWAPLTLVELQGAAASTGIDVLVSPETELILSRGRSEILMNADAARCANVWSEIAGPSQYVGPRHALGKDFDVHLLALDPDSLRLVYSHSPDLGITWDPEFTLFTHAGHVPEADAYDLAARGNFVAAVTAGAGGDVVLAKTTDSGTTWMKQVIYDVSGPGELLPGDEEWQPDGACALVLDYQGNPHVAWSNYLAIADTEGTVLEPSIDAGILYWSDSTGIVEIALPTQDSTMDPPVGRDGNFASQPDMAVDDDNRPFVVFAQLVSERDDSMRNYQRVYAVCSYDGGMTWGEPTDVGYGATGYDASFPTLADRVDRGNGFLTAHILFNADPFAGNSFWGNHPQIPVAIRYLRFGYIDLSANEEAGIPSTFSLGQNYPNPFNPTTTFSFSVPQSSIVKFTVFDILGREVATLVSERLSPGTYTRQWDATSQPSGVYFYRLEAGDFVETRKLVFVK